MHFNLVDEPWIPVIDLADGRLRELSLRETLHQAPQLREISDPSPLITVALHRLLLVVLHRVFGPPHAEAWYELWTAGEFPAAPMDAYLDTWRHRFDLFDPERPFYQVATLPIDSAGPVSKLVHEQASGNNTTLFDHTTDQNPTAFRPATAARALVAHQAFATGGLVSYENTPAGREHKSADAAPLVKAAVMLTRGTNLAETLLLNLLPYAPHAERPYVNDAHDRPAWERDDELKPGDRLPHGYLDWLTWQSRRIRLLPERQENGAVQVRQVIIMKGEQLPDSGLRYRYETMVAFTANLQAKKDAPWLPIAFDPDRALWRDSLALLQLAPERGVRRPRTTSWLDDLAADGYLERSATLPIELYGVTTDKAKVLLWRHERLLLPLRYLSDDNLRGRLGEALALAESVAGVLESSVRQLALILLRVDGDKPGGGEPSPEVVRALAASFAAGQRYWPALEAPFKQLLVTLPEDLRTGEDGLPEYGRDVLATWAETVARAAQDAFRSIVTGLDDSARSLKAIALAERSLSRIRQHTAPYRQAESVAV